MLGQTVSRFHILEKLGHGPHGDCYLARDTDSQHYVAFKVLGKIADRSRIDRMKRDAAVINELNHPSLARILEIGETPEFDYYVREYVSGDVLEEMLERKRLRRKYAISYAHQLCEALHAAHQADVVHGAIRPANLILMGKSRCKLVDFGLWRLDEGRPFTGELAIEWQPEKVSCLAPEQIESGTATRRSDVFAFGALVYEMSTGTPPFRRETTADTLDAILESKAKPIHRVTNRPPKGIEKFIKETLEKDPEKRAADLAGYIEPLKRLKDDYEIGAATKGSFFSENWERLMKVVFALVILTVIAGAVAFWWSRREQDFSASVSLDALTREGGLDTEPAISPKGDMVVFASDREGGGNLDLWIVPRSGGSPRRITTHPADDHDAGFSPDGQTLAFRSERDGGGIYTVPVNGGDAKLIARDGRHPRFSPDGGSIAYYTGAPGVGMATEGGSQIYIVDAAGGPSRRLQEQFSLAMAPVFSPDGQSVLFLGRLDPDQSRGEPLEWWVAPTRPGPVRNTGACAALRRQQLLDERQCVVPSDWVAGFVYFSRQTAESASVYRVKFDHGNPQVTSDAQKLTARESVDLAPVATAEGRFVFASQLLNVDIFSIPLNANEAKVTGEPARLTQAKQSDLYPTASADGAKMLFQSNRSGNFTPWLREFGSGAERAVTQARQDQMWPRLSPDGTRVAFTELRIAQYEHFVAPVGVGATEGLCSDCGAVVSDWTPNGKQVLINYVRPGTQTIGAAVMTPGSAERVEILRHPLHSITQTRVSPDGKSVVFVEAGDAGNSTINLAPFRGAQEITPKEWIGLTDGKSWDAAPQFSPNGRIVYFISSRGGVRSIWAQRISAAGRPEGAPFTVYPFRSARRSPALVPLNGVDLFVTRDKMLISLGDLTGQIWVGDAGK